MAARLCRGWLLSLLPAVLLSLHSPLSAPEPVTSQDAALLAGVPEDILCFSRSFEDLTCFWDEEEEAAASRTCHFYYWDVPTVCTVSTWRHGAGRTWHVCVFPSQDVRLFTQLHLRVLDATTNQTKYWRELSVDAVGLVAPPVNITARWAGAAGQLCVSWQPPLTDYLNFFLYEVRCCPASSSETPCRDIGLHCSTPDLQHVHCEWSWDPAEPRSSHQLFYRAPPSGPGTREDAWQRCEEASVGVQGTHTCTFQPRTGSAISVLVNVTRPHAPPTLSYFKEPFWLHQAVLTDAPQLVQATVSQGRLSLQWLPPLEALAGELSPAHLCCQHMARVRLSSALQVLQVPRAARKEVLDLRPGARYQAQVRAQPSGPWYQGSWSAWSKPVMVDAMADAGKGQGRSGGCSQRSHTEEGDRASQHSSSNAGWIIPSVTVVPLLFTGVLLGLRCTFPSLYSNVKQKLWPPIPDLHRALGSFLHESSKHAQANTFYKQPPEEATQGVVSWQTLTRA
ncbi:PREDICTED: thrombopoietin receptor [Pygoscelis adeliae]|uniref:thrombopoietin receptor n=1 Tax=Pygoscelis adeliae TaxID=9238 RepID=UPI0004F4E299|nr:PREDICTED: thrombopoietin receptor [Pygoscelis adeliae]